MTDGNGVIRAVLALGGVAGLIIVAMLQTFFAITAPVKAWSVAAHFQFALNALPFAYYLYRASRGWPERGTTIQDLLVHLVWVPTITGMTALGNFEIPSMMLAIFVAFMVISRQAHPAMQA